MKQTLPSVLEFLPAKVLVQAHLQVLSPEMIAVTISNRWWTDPALKEHLDPPPIDRAWDWNEMEIEYEGKLLASEKVGVLTDDGEIQGAMLVSAEPVPSLLVPSESALFVELLFTAPRNRSILRRDGRKYFGGVGPELLRWAAMFSQELGCHGRLKLDASPDYLGWYKHLGFTQLAVEPMLFEGVQYTPMELPLDAVAKISTDPTTPRQGTSR